MKTTPERDDAYWQRVGALGTCFSAIFVGLTAAVMTYQTALLRQTINNPNLQAREIDFCADFLSQALTMRHAYTNWSSQVRDKRPTGIIVDVDSDSLLRYALNAALNFGPMLQKVGLLSRPETQSELDSIATARIAMLQFMDQKNPTSKENEAAWISQFDDSFNRINERCTNVMLGKETGLL